MAAEHERTAGPFIGRPMLRYEDLRLVRGAGRYTDDISLPNQTYAIFVRSPHAHANIRKIDAARARALPGVVAVLTAQDYLGDGCKPIPQVPNPTDVIEYKQLAFHANGERKVLDEPHLPLAAERARYVGEPVAVAIAESAHAARDAAEAVEVDYEVLPAVVDAEAAITSGAQALWPSAPDNVALDCTFGDPEAVREAFAGADLVVEQTFRNQRIATAQMEPRAAIGDYDAASGQYISIAGSQGVHQQRRALAGALGVPPEKVRVVCPDTGGGFGSRTYLNPEQVVVVWAARRLGRPVKWTSDRTEAFLTDYQGRDLVTKARMALAADGRIRAYAFELLGNAGAHTVSYVPLNNGYRVSTTVYAVPAATARVRAAMTNTVSTGPFRGAGRPEATLAIERLLDIAAHRLGLDRAEIRRRNLVRLDQLPYKTAFGLTFDSGDFLANMERALELAGWRDFETRRAEAKARGRLRGIGIANYVESPVGFPHERVDVRVRTDDTVELVIGTQSTGQGHETTFAQVMADQLGVHPDQVRFVGGDTEKVVSGGGSHSDRSMRFAGRLMVEASAEIVGKARALAAELLQADEAAVEWCDGFFATPASNRRLSIFDVARASAEGLLAGSASYSGRIPAHPTGCAVCEVEIDPETGVVEIVRHSSIDDAGQPINPMILHGQVHGGIAQGAGQALLEAVVYAPDTGEMLTASFMDYGMPRADMLPFFDVELAEHPTHGNPLRVKGGGESGITPCLAAVMNAVCDALSPLGIEHLDMPATPGRVWRVIQDRD
ncbi:MAG: xanthine dehydrogenase family protein molybdopterin-binding subunit [Bradyrhizobiaceae bacterium]|nr:xanthine dehydrogenase family protein molybdopterin-binding subunit [Bradyrhizobiaceae bacterium]